MMMASVPCPIIIIIIIIIIIWGGGTHLQRPAQQPLVGGVPDAGEEAEADLLEEARPIDWPSPPSPSQSSG